MKKTLILLLIFLILIAGYFYFNKPQSIQFKIGMLHDNFATAIKGDEDFHYSFQLRFPIADVIKSDTTGADLPVTITGIAGSDVLFANYTFAIDYSGTVKNTYR